MSEKRAKELRKRAAALEQRPRITNMLELAKNLPGVPISPSDMDAWPWFLNCKNGIIDLHTGELMAHKREFFLTKIINVEYDKAAECPVWDRFLKEIQPDDKNRLFLQKAVGYALTGDISEQVFFLLHGVGANGKSTFLEILAKLLNNYAASTPFETFTEQKSGGVIRNDLAALQGIRFVMASEPGGGATLDESIIKRVTGGDQITARFLHAEFFSFYPQFKIFLAANHKPRVPRQDHGTWRRVMLIPFENVIPTEKQDKLLGQKLLSELPGILRWAVEGCQAWQSEGLTPPEAVCAATAEYRAEQDRLSGFIFDRCIVNPNVKVDQTELYAEYKRYSDDNRERAMSNRAFYAAMVERGAIKQMSNGTRYLLGVGLLSEYEGLNFSDESSKAEQSGFDLSLEDIWENQDPICDRAESDNFYNEIHEFQKNEKMKFEEKRENPVTSVTDGLNPDLKQEDSPVTKGFGFVTAEECRAYDRGRCYVDAIFHKKPGRPQDCKPLATYCWHRR